MSLENYSSTIILLVGSALTIFTGYWLYFVPPKKINWFYGYRTKKSMKNQEHWDFAQRFSGKLFIRFGIILLISAFLVYVFNFNQNIANIIAVAIFIIGALFIIYKTEKAIEKEFKD